LTAEGAGGPARWDHARSPTDYDRLCQLLEAVRDGDFADSPVDNEMLAAALKLPLASVALAVQEAKARSLIWGIPNGRQPGPWYTDLEVTVQGQRFLARRPA
jgi:hypothetical protein